MGKEGRKGRRIRKTVSVDIKRMFGTLHHLHISNIAK